MTDCSSANPPTNYFHMGRSGNVLGEVQATSKKPFIFLQFIFFSPKYLSSCFILFVFVTPNESIPEDLKNQLFCLIIIIIFFLMV